MKILSWCIAAFILMGAACPTYIAPLPPPLKAPVFTNKKVTWCHQVGTFREVIDLTWQKPSTDSIGISQYTLLRKAGNETAYSLVMREIPDSITNYQDPIENFGFPTPASESQFKMVWYRIFTVDTLGRSGDTSVPCSLTLAIQPILIQPLDTLNTNQFSWQVWGYMIMGSYTTTFAFADSTRILWEAPATAESFLGESGHDDLQQALPDSLWPLARGRYFWSVKLDITGGNNPQSIIVGSCDVP